MVTNDPIAYEITYDIFKSGNVIINKLETQNSTLLNH